MIRRILAGIFGWALLLIASNPGTLIAGETFYFRHDNVLGTSLDLKIEASSGEKAGIIEQRILGEIERLRLILSTYDPQSEFSRWCRTESAPVVVSRELMEVMSLCDLYREKSDGAFNPSVQAVCQLWREASKTGEMPTSDQLKIAVDKVGKKGWRLDLVRQTATRLTDGPFTLDALAKGYIVDRAATAAKAAGAISVTVQIGGDLAVLGKSTRDVEIADPMADAENAPPIARVRIRDQGLATSGRYRRGYQVGDRWFSHIVDPRTGQPSDGILGSTVIASTTVEADALATVVSVMSIKESLALIESIPGAACLVVDKSGNRIASSRWANWEVASPLPVNQILVQDKDSAKPDAKGWKSGMEMIVQLEINKPANENRGYRRPYVAVWLEDKDEFPIRTLALWLQTTGKGMRWLPDLKRWNKNDGLRKVVDDTDLVRTVSSATRVPGKYKLVWDGKDDGGKLINQGQYTLYLEAAREHGTYQLIKEEITIGENPFSKTLKGNQEIKGATVEYKQKQGGR